MSKRVFFCMIVLAAVLIFGGYFALAAVFGEAWPSYGKAEQKIISGYEYMDDFVQVRVVKAEGRYLVAFTLLDDNLIARYGDGRVHSVMTHLGTIFDEESLDDLPYIKISVHRKGFFKKHLTDLRFAAEPDILHDYPTMQEARNALVQGMEN